MNRDLMLSILAMDSYNRGYGQGVLLNVGDSTTGQNEAGRQLGNAIIGDFALPTSSVAAGFYALAYNWNGETVISYRGTAESEGSGSDKWNGWTGRAPPISNHPDS